MLGPFSPKGKYYERNTDIVQSAEQGESKANIARRHGLSATRVAGIIAYAERHEQAEKYPVEIRYLNAVWRSDWRAPRVWESFKAWWLGNRLRKFKDLGPIGYYTLDKAAGLVEVPPEKPKNIGIQELRRENAELKLLLMFVLSLSK